MGLDQKPHVQTHVLRHAHVDCIVGQAGSQIDDMLVEQYLDRQMTELCERNAVDNVVGEQMGFYLQENSEMSQQLIRKAIKAREAREAARKAREESRNGKKRKKGESLLSGKL